MRYVTLRSLAFALGLLALTGGLPSRALADEEPEAAAGDASKDPSWDAKRFWFADVVPPAKAWERVLARVRETAPQQRRALQGSMVETYLAAWSGEATAPDDRLALGTMLLQVKRPADALASYGAVLADGDASAAERARAAVSTSSVLSMLAYSGDVEPESLTDQAEAVEAWLRKGEGDAALRASAMLALANWAAVTDRVNEAVALDMDAARAEPGRAAQAARGIERLLMGTLLDPGAYDALRGKGKALFEELRSLGRQNLEALPEDAPDQQKRRAEAVVNLLAKSGKSLELLGKPAPAWTLDHAFGDVKDLQSLRGKVVVLDFWATWCGWCIKSFPAVRELVADYAGKDLVVVGVTTTQRVVYPSRFDLDADMKDKATPGEHPRPAAVLQGGRDPGDGVPVLEEDAYRAKEKEVLQGFIQAHEMSWPVVMIDKDEPAAKYALMGWPHAVILDREGRVRFLESGALLKDRPGQVAHFRHLLDQLLAEGAADD